ETIEYIQVGAEEQESSQCRRTDTVALGERLGRIARTIQSIGNVAHRFCPATHFCNTASIISNGTKSIHSKDVGTAHQHTHRCDCGPKDAANIDDVCGPGNE